MNRFYAAALESPLEFGELEENFMDGNKGLSMIARGMARGQSRMALYSAGVSGVRAPELSTDIMVGAYNIGEGGIMKSITGFLIDVAHILLMVGGLYLVVASFGWVK